MKVVENFAVDVFQSNVYILNSRFLTNGMKYQ